MPSDRHDGTRRAAGTTRGERIRCFAAAFLEAESAARLEATMTETVDRRLRDHRASRAIPPERYHVTLKFFGESDAATVREAMAAVAALNGHRSSAAVTAVAGFPRARNARLVAAELAADEQLEAWWAALGARFGFEHRRFRPHVTVLRLRGVRAVRRVVLPRPLPVTLMTPGLYSSEQTPEGVRYRPLSAG